MHYSLFAAAGAAAILTFGSANAQLLLKEDPSTDQRVIVNLETEAETTVYDADPTTGARPVDCPEGSFFMTHDPSTDTRSFMSCDDDNIRYREAADGEGAMPAEGLPEGALLLTEDSSIDQKEIVTGEEAAAEGEQPQ